MPHKLPNQLQWLNYHHLYYFFVIAKEGSVAKAAQRLSLGQPTLSAQLKLLEESLDKNLFDRRKQRLYLTDAGKIAFQYAEQVFNLGSEMVEVLEDRLINNRVHIQIGALDSVPKSVIMKLLVQANRIGNCKVTVLEGTIGYLQRELSSHQIDLLLSNYPPHEDFPSIYAKSIAKLEVLVCGANKFKNLKKKFPSSLQDQPFIFPTGHSKLRRDLEHFFSVNNLRVDQTVETQDTSLQTLLGAEGIGLVPITKMGAESLLKENKMIVLGRLDGVFEEIWLASADRKIRNPIAAELMRSFKLA